MAAFQDVENRQRITKTHNPMFYGVDFSQTEIVMNIVRVRARLTQWTLLHGADRSNWNHNVLKSRRFRFQNAHCSFWNWNRLDFRKHNENRQSSRTTLLMDRVLRCQFERKSSRFWLKSIEAGLQLYAWAQPAWLARLASLLVLRRTLDRRRNVLRSWCLHKTVHAITIILAPLYS